jgi:hypothetical protein
MNEMPAPALTLSFQDAIALARGIGIYYLWIDSLCIIQDKESDDWTNESSKMAAVYSNSFLNIAATSAKNGHGGLFYRGSEQPKLAIRIKAKLRTGTVNCIMTSRHLYDISNAQSPLLHRGWVLQERILAPRTIHFTSEQLFWECNQTNLCGARPHERWYFGSSTHLTSLRKKPLSKYSWYDIVREYSRCKLTFETDKLVAISGIARAMQQCQHGSEYYAGLWSRGMTHQLLWRVDIPNTWLQNPTPEPRRNIAYLGPSWSWASVQYPVNWNVQTYGANSQFHATIDTVDITYSGLDQYGAVSAASMHLRCELLECLDSSFLDGCDVDGGTCSKHVQLWVEKFRLTIYWDDGKQPKWKPIFFLLPLQSRPYPDRSGPVLWGLVLQSTCTRRGEYQRVGMFDCDYSWDKGLSSSYVRVGGGTTYSIIRRAREIPLPVHTYVNVKQQMDELPTYNIILI